MKNQGTADLPLHGGSAPRWLFDRMVRLSKGITEVIIEDYGREEFLRRITDPHWFQALSCTIGFDWHSSGTTTTTCGALKEGLDPEQHGLAFTGGKGRTSRKTPEEIKDLEDIYQISPTKLDKLIENSKISAKVDNSCVQDQYQLYHHSFIVSEKGDWGVVQQGMKEEDGYARRYHWLSESVEEFVEEPHEGVCCDRKEKEVLDMTAKESDESREISVDLINDGPEHIRKYLDEKGQTTLTDFNAKELKMPSHHPVLDMDLKDKEWRVLEEAYEVQPEDYEELISLKGMGPKKIRALALVSDLIYGSEASWEDPVKYSFAHGGKDGTPYPVDKEVYDSTIEILEEDVKKAEVPRKDKKHAMKRLSSFLDASSEEG
ncbi:MAG: DUF763 domain-containing protein [Candidatus Thermoplasmatota archaeon]|nr:DUF763 domain-containing protein [Candidatus Thermoplasmatota archaeon]